MEFTEKEIRRFHSKYVEDGSSGCWNWIHGKFNTGYGMLSSISGMNRPALWQKKTMSAHRVSWMIHNKSAIPDGFLICHHCDNRACVNPSHLYLGTSQDNNRDTVRRGRANRLTGSACSWSKLTEENVLEILNHEYGKGANKALSAKFGVSQSQISHVRRGHRWPRMRKFLKTADVKTG